MIRKSALLSVHLDSILLSSHTKDFEHGIHRSLAWISAVEVMCEMKFEIQII